MPRRAKIHFVSLRSSLVNLPISIYGPLLERSVRPQTLAVHLSSVSNKKVEAYVGWTGMASAYSLAQFNAGNTGDHTYETVDIDPQYAEGLGFSEGDIVDIGLLHDLSIARMVGTEPVSSDDWEIIEIHASHVESTLLSQVRVAKAGQEINVWVQGRTRVRLRIVSIDPPAASGALLLSTNSEVSIAPKPQRQKAKGGVPPPAATPSETEKKPSSKPEALRALALRVLPLHLLPVTKLPAEPEGKTIACISHSSLSSLVYPSSQSAIEDLSGKYHEAILRCIREPSDPAKSSASSEDDSTPAQSKILSPGSRPTVNGAAQSLEDEPTYLCYSSSVPEGHISFITPHKSIKDWSIVKVSTTSRSIPLKHSHQGVPSSSRRTEESHASKLAATALLLTGRSGSGKTSIANAVASIAQRHHDCYSYTHTIDLSTYVKQPISQVKLLLSYALDKAAFHRPSVLILDNIDKLMPVEVEHSDSFRSRHIAELFISLFSPAAQSTSRNLSGIVCIATAASTASIHASVNSSHIFHQTIALKPPNRDARRDILSSIVAQRLQKAENTSMDSAHSLNFAALATNTEGYSATDLQDLVTRAMHQMAMRSMDEQSTVAQLTYGDFEEAQKGFVPLSLRDIKLQKSGVAWSDIGGARETKRVLRETLEWPTKYGPIFAQAPLRLRSGLLLYGYPGCGKTLLASAVAKECGLNFISVKGPELLNKYIGASEKSVRDLFDRASAAKPCVLFFDEFDSIAPKRGHDSTGVTDRVVNQMLTQMDGAEGLEGVYVLAATSRPDLIDSALLRPGRLDKSLLCDMPNEEEREEILEAVSSKIPMAQDVSFRDLARVTEGFSGADLQALVYNAHLEVVHQSIVVPEVETSKNGPEETPLEHVSFGGGGASKRLLSKAEESALQRRLSKIQSSSRRGDETPQAAFATPATKRHEVTSAHFTRVLKTTRPSLSDVEVNRLRRVYWAFVDDRDPGMEQPPSPSGIGNRVTLG